MRPRLTHRPGLARRLNRQEWRPRRIIQPIKNAGFKLAQAWEAANAERTPDFGSQFLLDLMRRAE